MTSGSASKSLFASLKPLFRLGKHRWWVPLFLWTVMANPAFAAEQVELRVAIKKEVSQVKIGSSTNAIVRDGSGQVLGQITAMDGFSAQATGGNVAIANWKASRIWIEPSGDGLVWIGDRWYRGRTLLAASSNQITAINYVDLEKYLYSVLGGEMPPTWPLEALKAQAVAARSYALHQREKTANELYDVGNTTAWQVYEGVEDEYTSTQQAVDATQGQVLAYEGNVIEAVFHSSSGGHTENVEDVWTQPLPYLRAVPDYDQEAPVYQWEKTFTQSELSSLISGVGNIRSMVPERKTPQGRIVTMRVVGDAGEKVISGNAIRSALDLKSTLFEVKALTNNTQDKAGSGTLRFQITGRGFGHGLGMSQYGANGLARRGYNYQQILLHYYKSASLARIQVE